MADRQHPLGSGFGARSTAGDVLAGIDLGGQRAVVTGGHSGLGLETTRALAEAGADVIVAARDTAAARSATRGLARVTVARLDLADLASVRRFASHYAEAGGKNGTTIDILVNNAGVMACPETRLGPGWEAHFAINHLGHFALTNLLWPLLADGARVVSVSSAGHHYSPVRWDDLHFEAGYDKWLAYAQSKTANALFAVHLDRLGRERGIRAFSVHPGKIFTPLLRHVGRDEMVAAGWIDRDGNPADPTFKSPAQGAATQVWAATSPLLAGLGGLYCEDCDVARRNDTAEATLEGVKPYATDEAAARRLWDLSAEMTGIGPGQSG